MFGSLNDLKKDLERVVADLDPDVLDGATATQLTGEFSQLERLAAAGKALCAGRVASSGAWKSSGEKSPARWMARETGTSVGRALSVLDAADSLRELPKVDKALRSGVISETQATEIAPAASADPSAQNDLLEAAQSESVQELKQRCARVKAAATPDETERYNRIRSQRRLRHWRDADGAFRLDALMTPDAGAVVLSALEPYAQMLARDARAQGRKERREALLADALVAVAEHTRACESSCETAGPAPAVRVLVDHDVLHRGEVAQGGICEIQGIGPIPAATAAGMLADSNLAALVVDGLDIKGVSHLGRTVNARLRTALEARDPHCVVPGCYVDHHMEIDHVRPMKMGGQTKLENLARLCKWHHGQKTYHGYRLSGSPGKWRWEPPPGRAPTGPAQTGPAQAESAQYALNT